MNIFGWLSTGRAFARPANSRASSSGARPANSRASSSGARPANSRAPNAAAAYESKSQHRPSRASPAHILPLMRSGGLSALPYGIAGMATGPAPLADYITQVRESYLANAVAQRACRLVAEAISGAPFTSPNPHVLRLVQAPSAGQNLIETLAIHLMLHGNAYVQVIRKDAGYGDNPDGDADCPVAELYAPRPERILVDTDARGWPCAFRYRIAGSGDYVRLPAEAPDGRPLMAHIRRMHPLDDHYGLGCLSAASAAVQVHNAAAQWNTALLKNAARPSGALVHDGSDLSALSDDQFTRLRAELDAGFAGSANVGRPLLLEGGLKWQAMSMTPADMDFAGLRDAAAREIAMAFGVPPMLLGLPGDATYANYKEASRALWRLTLLPLAHRICDAISHLLQPYLPDATIGIDIDRITELAEDRERMWAQIGAADFLSRDEKRALLGLEPVPPASVPVPPNARKAPSETNTDSEAETNNG